MRLLVGTSGYAYKEWKGSFYPQDLPADRMLSFYADVFETVEVNNTFYRMPTANNIAAWASVVPPTFTFVLKAPQRITHMGRLQGVEDLVRHFCTVALGLGSRLGAVLLQLPPNFKKDLPRLRAFLPQIAQDVRCVFEFRHPSWFDQDTYELLRARNVGLCVADTELGTTPLEATADFGYLRLRDEGYTTEDLARWAERVRAREAAWRDAFVFFKHEEKGKGPEFAREFRRLLA